MNKAVIIKDTERFVKKLLFKEKTGHDWWHIERVRKNAKLINKKEKANSFIIDMAILLHDVGDRKVIKKKKDDYSIAESFLLKQKIPSNLVEEIMFIIKNMSFSKSFNKKQYIFSKEFKIAQDADRLDAIGAIGIARALAYGGIKGRLIYDPTQKPKKYNNEKEYQKGSSSTLHFFEERLFSLKNLMNTNTAKQIAKSRHDFTRNFQKQFLNEWNGKK